MQKRNRHGGWASSAGPYVAPASCRLSRRRPARAIPRQFASTLLAASACLLLLACSASRPGDIETLVAQEAKRVAIAGRDLENPLPDTPEVVKTGEEHFQHHCQVCHGLDGHNTGVPFAGKMSPNVPDLSDKFVQQFTDGQLKIIIQNGIRFSGMPGWQGTLDDKEMWAMVHFIRHLPPKGSLGVPAVFKESEEEHQHAH